MSTAPANIDAQRAAIRAAWPSEYADGCRCGLRNKFDGPREPGGYPKGFNAWPLDRRNAWFAGFNKGHVDRVVLQKEMSPK